MLARLPLVLSGGWFDGCLAVRDNFLTRDVALNCSRPWKRLWTSTRESEWYYSAKMNMVRCARWPIEKTQRHRDVSVIIRVGRSRIEEAPQSPFYFGASPPSFRPGFNDTTLLLHVEVAEEPHCRRFSTNVMSGRYTARKRTIKIGHVNFC